MKPKDDVRDPQVLATVRPRDVGFYLRRKGWKEAERATNASYWVLGEEQALMVPLTQIFHDYALRIAQVLETLRVAERRPIVSIFSDIRQSSSDVLRVRVVRSDEKDGSIPLIAAPRIFAGAAEMLLYAAASTVEPRPVHRVLPESAKELKKVARFGQTEHGSYVVNVLAPLPGNYDLFAESPNARREEKEDLAPFTRRSLRLLMRTLDKIHLVENESHVIEQVATGVSAELCRAIYRASGGGKGLRSLEVSANWAPAIPENDSTPSSATFAKTQVKVIRDAGKTLGEIRPVLGARIQGRVFRLSRTLVPDSGDDVSKKEPVREGIITVLAPTKANQPARHITMAVNAEFHEVAIRAYHEDLTVTCVGDLLDRPPAPYLFKVTEFRITK